MDDPTEINSKTKEFWDNESGTWDIGNGIHWTELIAVHERLNSKISGNTHVDFYAHIINFIKGRGLRPPVARCLTLGCGAGDFERALSKYNFCLRHDAYDLSEGAIEKAKNKAKQEGLSHIFYDSADINELVLLPESYDVIFGIQSVHHLAKLEHVFSEVRKALKPGGLFILHEFVGPTKFQWSEAQLNIINGVLHMLPDKYRKSRIDGLTFKKEHWRPTLEQMEETDPSEAIRSGDILAVLPSYFEILEKKDLGGAVLHSLLDGIAGNFEYRAPEDMRLLKMIFEIEDVFMDIGEIKSDFVVIIATNFSCGQTSTAHAAGKRAERWLLRLRRFFRDFFYGRSNG